jgi:DNA-binding protein Alba
VPRDVVVVRDRPVSDYVLNVIMLFNSGSEEVELVGRGMYISKAVAVFNALRDRLEETLKVIDVEIGSEVRGRSHRRVPYIKFRLTQGL